MEDSTQSSSSNSSQKGVTIILSNSKKEHFLKVGSPFNIKLFVGKNYNVTRVILSQDTKLVLGSACLDTVDFSSGHARLCFRVIERGGKKKKAWQCLCNYLSKDRGGKSLPALTPLGLVLVGPCAIEFMADGSSSVESIDLAGSIMSADSASDAEVSVVKPASNMITSKNSCIDNKDKKVSNKLKSKNKKCKASNADDGMKSKTIMSNIMWIFVKLFLLAGLVGIGGGGKGSQSFSPSLRPQSRYSPQVLPKKNTGRKVLGEETGQSPENVDSDGAAKSPRTSRSLQWPYPTNLPTTTMSPTELPSLSTLPTQSASPSNPPTVRSMHPSTSTLPTVECMDLTVAFFIPAGRNYGGYNFTLNIISQGEDVNYWSMNFKQDIGDLWDNFTQTFDWDNFTQTRNQIFVEHSNGTNSNSAKVCLPQGTYSFSVSCVWNNSYCDVLDYVPYVLSTGGQKLHCGVGLYDDWDVTFVLPHKSMNGEVVESGCGFPDCSLGDENCFESEFIYMQCYYSAFLKMDSILSYRDALHRDVWFDDTCGPVLFNACASGQYLGFNDETRLQEGDEFCVYHQCAHTSFTSNNWDDYYGCEYLFSLWKCEFSEYYAWDYDVWEWETFECNGNCRVGDGQVSNLPTSCDCYFIPACEDGDLEVCSLVADYCCSDEDEATEEKCKSEYLKKGCDKFLQEDINATVTVSECCLPGDYSCEVHYSKIACDRNLRDGEIDLCYAAQHAICNTTTNVDMFGERYTTQCMCNFWDPICLAYPGETACREAVYSCCGDFYWCRSNIAICFCGCDFFEYVQSSSGYKDDEFSYAYCSEAILSFDTSYDVEQESLNYIYSGTGGEYWLNSTGWLGDETSRCDWFGVFCNNDGSVIGLNLRSNNLTGPFPSQDLSGLIELQSLDLANNSLVGAIEYTSFFTLRNLVSVDLSDNQLEGEADILFSPSIEFVNFSHNNFHHVSRYLLFKGAYSTLQSCDLSHNNINQNASELFTNTPPSIKELIISDNFIHGTLPIPFGIMENMRVLRAENNHLSGPLFDIARSLPRLRELNLSNQKQKQKSGSGLSGSIPYGLSSILDLAILDLSFNQLTNTIPTELGSLPGLKLFNISNNMITGSIPSPRKLADVTAMLDFRFNKLSGRIPPGLGNFEGALVLLAGNQDVSAPAPLSLCQVPGFDLVNTSKFCPTERNVLKEFYDSAKGAEWTNSSMWIDEYEDHCSWHGVTCMDGAIITVALNLSSNGLSGLLNNRIGDLASLEVLDLSDNDIKGSLPGDLGNLTALKTLRLSYNAFIGTTPIELGHLHNLQLVHLHGNRLTGEMPHLNFKTLENVSSFITDCGVPSDFIDPFSCPECTMCCNSVGDCQSTEAPELIQVGRSGFNSYADFSWVFILSIFGGLCIVSIISYMHDRYWNSSSLVVLDRTRIVDRDAKYALDTIGSESVYSFFLSKSWFAWVTSFAVMGMQTWILTLFVDAAEMTFSDGNSDFVYSWRCPRNSTNCDNTEDQDLQGTVIFIILMISHLMKDIINGTKLILLCAKRRHSVHARIRFFVGGVSLVLITAFTMYASAVYNLAIARSNTDIVVNAVIILFIADIDEQFYMVFSAAFPGWMNNLKQEQENDDCSDENNNGRSQSEYDKLASSLVDMQRQIEQLQKSQEMNLANRSTDHAASQPKITRFFHRDQH